MTNALAVQEQREAHPMVVGIQQRMQAPGFAALLPAGMDIDRFAAVTLQAIVKNPDLLSCTPESVITAVVEAAQDGLEPTGARGGAHLVKFGPEAVLIRDYRGIIRIVIESGAATRVDAHVVRHGEEFSWDPASPDPIQHRPNLDGEGEARGYYVVFWLPDGTKKAEYMPISEIQKVRAKSRGKDSMGWTEFFDQMARKTVIKRGANYLNLRPDIRERLMREDSAEFEGQVISIQRDEQLAASRSKIHERAARLTGGASHPEQPAAASTTPGTASASTRGAAAGDCPHPSERHVTVDAGVECGACGDLLARRDEPGTIPGGPQSGQSPPAAANQQPVAGDSPPVDQPPAPTTLTDATARVGRLAIQARIVERLDTDDDWAAFDDAMRARGIERLPLEESPEAIAAWNAIGDRLVRGDFSAPAGDDPAGHCQAHQLPWKFVAAGRNRAGNKFRSFWTCPERDCSNKPTKAWRDRQPQKAGEELPD